jgi:purine-cytosine permease-like protein
MWKNRPKIFLSDTNQSWWDLFAIQSVGCMGIPTLASSILVLQQNSFLGAVLTVIVGNAIMWFIRFGILSMSHENRQSTLDISKIFLGDFGAYAVSFLLLVSTFSWFVAQTSIGGEALTHLVSIHEMAEINQFSQISVFLGVLSTILCLGGMRLLRKLSVFSLPILVGAFLVILVTIPDWSLKSNFHGVSLSGLSVFLATNLGISSDLPTFFRHSRTWKTAVYALTSIQIMNIAFGIFGLLLGVLVVNGFEINSEYINSHNNYLLRFSLIVFILVSVICSNVANVYSSSVGWEILAPSALVGRKEYLVIGLGLTILFVLVSNLFNNSSLLRLSEFVMINLCVIFVIGYLISRKLGKLPDPWLQVTYFSAWAIASGVNIIQFFYKIRISSLFTSSFLMIGIISISFFWVKVLRKGS